MDLFLGGSQQFSWVISITMQRTVHATLVDRPVIRSDRPGHKVGPSDCSDIKFGV
jgi:hypothetical protein